MPSPFRVLVVDDDKALLRLLDSLLRAHGHEVRTAASGAEALALLQPFAPDLVLCDVQMEGMSGLELCERITALQPDLPVVVMTAHASLESAVGALRAGAYDFVGKPLQLDELRNRLSRVLESGSLKREVKQLRRAVADAQGYEELSGASPVMQELYRLLERVAGSDATVLVTGESGTGKELVARALHRRGKRRDGPFLAINCSALPEALLEAELFGHAKGAFTDAQRSRKGLFAEANGGTLLLDEVGELPLSVQPKLLRALQERKVRPLGESAELDFDVRLVAATNRDLTTAVEEGRFREDLFFRLNVIHLELPPLRARGGDVLLLAQRFLERFAAQAEGDTRGVRGPSGLSAEVAQRLLAYSWPGNVRELQNCMERAVALTRGETISLEDLPEKVRDHRPSEVLVASQDPSELVTLEEVERRYVLKVLEALGGNKTLAAQTLGLDRKTLYRKLERWQA